MKTEAFSIGGVKFEYEVIDNVSDASQTMASNQDKLAESADKTTESHDKLSASAEKTQASVDSQNISFMTQIMAVRAVAGGVHSLTGAMTALGWVNEENARRFQILNASIQLVIGTFQLIKGVVMIVNMLKEAEIGLAAVETYRSIINKGAGQAAIVALGIGAAAGVLGYFAGSAMGGGGGGTNVEQNITVTTGSAQDGRDMARTSLEVMGG